MTNISVYEWRWLGLGVSKWKWLVDEPKKETSLGRSDDLLILEFESMRYKVLGL